MQKRSRAAIIPGQFVNPANSGSTQKDNRTRDLEGYRRRSIDLFIAGVGTGGTLTGVGEYLKSQNPDVKIVALGACKHHRYFLTGKGGPHKIQGIGAGFVPDVLNTTVYDEIFTVENDDAFATGKLLAKKEGILVGISSGAALYGAIELAKRPENKGKTIVALLPDTGEQILLHTALHGVEYEFFKEKQIRTSGTDRPVRILERIPCCTCSNCRA